MMIDRNLAKKIIELQKKKKRHENYLVGSTVAAIISAILIPIIKGLVLFPWTICLTLIISETIAYFKDKKSLFEILLLLQKDEDCQNYIQHKKQEGTKSRAEIPACCWAVVMFFVVILMIPCAYFMITENYIASVVFGALFIIAEMLFALKVSEERNKDTAILIAELYVMNNLPPETTVDNRKKANCSIPNPSPSSSMIKQPTPEEIEKNRQKNKKIVKYGLIGIVSFYAISVLIIIVLSAVGVIPSEEQESSTAATKETLKPLSFADYYFNDIDVFLSEYDANPVAADAKYLDKTIQVTGKVYMIDNTIKYAPFVIVKGEGLYSYQIAYFYFTPFDEDELMKIKEGDQITIRGIVKENLAGTPIFSSSEIIFVNGEIVYGK